jgi:hypothetical protein
MLDLERNQIDVKGAIFSFRRRRYGRQTFTWLWYKNENDQWTEYKGDPWPSVRVPMKDLLKVREELLAQFPIE